MESSVQDQIWTLGTTSHVLWTHEFTQHLPRDDECHLQGGNRETCSKGNNHMNLHG
jgi:hypothetical protein